MATFKVGQRVKVVSAHGWFPRKPMPSPIGAEGVVVAVAGGMWDYVVELTAFCHNPTDLAPNHWGFDADHLAPLTDPKADQFIEWVKKIKPEPVSVPVAELERFK